MEVAFPHFNPSVSKADISCWLLYLVISTIITTEHVNSGRGFLDFFLRLFHDSFSGSSTAASSTTRASKCTGIRKVCFVNLSLIEGAFLEFHSDRQDGLEGIGNTVCDTGGGGHVECQRKFGNGVERRHELNHEDVVGDVKDLGIEERSRIVHRLERHTVREGLDAELLEKGGLRRSDLFPRLDEVGVVRHLDLTPRNLRRDVERLEEGGLTGIATGGTLGNDDVDGSAGPDLRGGGTDVRLE